MKKNYFKKSLSLFMAVLMLMTCWVWIAPEHSHVSAAEGVFSSLSEIITANQAEMNKISGDTNITAEAVGGFTNDSSGYDTSDYYVNLLYSGKVTTTNYSDGNAEAFVDYDNNTLGNGPTLYLDWHYATAVMMYDGVTIPVTGVMMIHDTDRNGGVTNFEARTYSSWLNNSDLKIQQNWKGITNNLNFTGAMNQSENAGHGATQTDKYFTRKRNDALAGIANLMKFTGTMSDTEYSRTIYPEFQQYGEGMTKNDKKTSEKAKGDVPIYVVNVAPLKNAYNQALELYNKIIADYGKYTPASVGKFVELANALLAANPNNTAKFNWADTANAVSAYASAAQTAVKAWNDWHKGNTNGGLVEIKKVDWKDGDDNLLKTEYYGVGQTPSYSGATPTKTPEGYNDIADKGWQYTFTHTGWSPAIEKVTADATYTATFNSNTNFYVVTFDFADSRANLVKTYVPGSTIPTADIPAFSTRNPDAGQHYTYKWVPGIGTVTEDITYVETLVTDTHNYGAWETVEDSTCSSEGSKQCFCTVCGYKETGTIDKKPHNLTKVGATNSTCTVQGNIDYWYCSECKNYYSDAECTKEIENGIEGTKRPLAEHAFGGATVIEGDEVNHTLHCKNEGCTATKIDKHNYMATGMESTATCVTPGRTPMRCTCGMTKQQDGALDPNNHEKLTVVGQKDATCDVPGYTGDTYCLACDADMNDILKKGEEIPALGHKFTGAIRNDGNGKHSYLCVNGCGTYGGTVDCSNWVEDGENCKCKDCGYTKIHTWETTWTPASDNTENAPGKMTHTCTVCKATETVACTNYKQTAHSDANCYNPEETTYQCSDCGHTYKVIGDPALGHDYTGTIKDNGDGTHSYLCNNGCGTYGGTVDCSNWVEDGENCKCSDCGYTKAHAWGKWVNNSDNVADAPGKMTRTCSVCNATDTTDCTYDEVYTPATCLDDAYTTYTCKDENCGHGYTVIDKGSAKGHNFTGEYKFDATEDKHQQLCANGCGAYGVGTEADKWADCKWTYENKEDGKHTATCVCGNSEEQACSGGTATCTDEAICEFCKTAYGSKADHLFEGDVVALGNGSHAYRCEFCNDQSISGVGKNEGDSVPCSGGSATCTTLATCEECKASYGELKEDAHKWGTPVSEKNDTEHTHKYICEYNSEHTKSEACDPEVDSVVDPTCEVPGYTVQKCQLCSATWNTDPTEALGHSWGDWASNENGTHTRTCDRSGCCYGENGAAKTETAACTKENATVVVTDPTCTEGGFSTYTCNLCGYDWVDDNTAALGHDYSKKIYREEYLFEKQNCTQGNIYFFACSRCGKNGKDETDTNKYTDLKFEADKPLSHKWVEKVDEKYRISYATCDTAAKYYKSCEACGISSEETFTVTEAYGHEWIQPSEEELENFVAVEPDCETDAEYYYVCKVCDKSSKGLKTDGETWTLESDKPGHSTLIEVAGVAGNCEKDTTIAHWYCKDCGKKFKDANGDEAFVGSTIIKAPGHSWIKYKAVDATCETDGHADYDKCSVCGATKGTPTVYPKKGHNFTADAGYYIDEVNDYHAFYCVNAKCLPATDDNGEAVKDAKGRAVYNKAYGIAVDGQQVKYTVTDNGDGTVTVSGGIKCSFDNSTITTVDGVHSHNDVCVCSNSISIVYTDESPETVAPTCVDYGYKSHKCNVCGAVWQTDMVEPNGHTLATTGVSNGDGTHSLKCTVDSCDYKKDTVKCSGGTATCKDQAVCDICSGPYGETLPHTLSDNGWSYNGDAKCGVDGTESQMCSKCEVEVTRKKANSALNHELLGEYTYDISGWESKPADFNLDIKEPNCKESGLTINYCTNAGCGYYKTKTVKASASYHKFTETTTAGTCTTGAVTTKVCSVCNYTERTTSEAADHQWQETGRDLPDCTNSGCIYYICLVCKEEAELDEITADFTDSNYVTFMGMKVDISGIKAKGHKWGNLEIEKASTCSREGRGYHSCNVCGKEEKVDLPVIEGAHIIGHQNSTLKRMPASAPTCKAPGNREYYECMSCPYSQNANDDYYLEPVGHKDNDGDGRCDSCYDPMDKATINDGCICHKSGFSAFIYKILRIFWKLFKMKKSCDCGAVHY